MSPRVCPCGVAGDSAAARVEQTRDDEEQQMQNRAQRYSRITTKANDYGSALKM